MAMALAPDGRQLSPGEVYEEAIGPAEEPEWKADLNVSLICPDCQEDPPNLVEESSAGDTICSSCGRVLQEHGIDTRSEWRTFSNDDQNNDDPSRVGDAANPLLNGSQLTTTVGTAEGHNNRARDLSRAQSKSTHDKTNKSLLAAYKQISALCDSSHISSAVTETAKHLYKITDTDKLFKGKSQDAIIAGCIFIACRQHDVPRSFREIFKLTNVSKKEIGRTFKTLESHLAKKNREPAAGSGTVSATSGFKLTKSTEASELILRACNKLNLDNQLAIIAQKAATRVTELGVAAGRSPLSITGACIYLIAHLMGHPRTPKEIGLAVDVSDGTIRTAYKLIYNARDRVISEEWVKQGGDKSRIPVS